MKFEKLVKGGLAALMTMSMVACSNGGSAAPAETAATTDGGTETTAAAAGEGAFKLGISGPLTGGASVYGQAVKNAAEIAVEEINAKGGVQFDFKAEDDEHDAEKAVNAYNALKDWGMQLSLCTVTSAPGAAVAPLYQADSTFAITPSGSSLAVIYADSANQTNAYGNVFQMCFTDPNQGVASADYLSAHTNLGTKVAVIYKNDDNYSTGIYEKFTSEAEVKGLEVVYTGTFAGEDNDFNVQLTQAQAAGADVLFLPIYYQPASTILKQANDMGYKPTVFGVDGMDGILSMEGFDTSLAEGVYLLTPFSADATDDLTKNFVAKYQEKYGEVPNQFAADAYDCVYAIAQALEAAGATADMSNADLCTALVGQFTSMTFNGLTGTDVTWNANGEVSKAPKAVIIENGVYVGVED
ncbi:MAG: ABC transporter substrate-binding protein [Solobacterium sp.]|nr:ABC transporter substrate-binding protein [Solobacterium sp.]MBR3345894.1 ABC transporter substrate-binding protein [Solobacterium sp.]